MKAKEKEPEYSTKDGKKPARKKPRSGERKKQRKKQRKRGMAESRNIVFRLRKTMAQYYPDLYERMGEISEVRKRKQYQIEEVIVACIAMYLFKVGSRNGMNNEREEAKFKKNYRKVFKLRLPHMDTVDQVMRKLKEEELERLKKEMIQTLMERKVFAKNRLFGKYYRVVIDGTHVMTVGEGHCEHCLRRRSKKGKVTYFHYLLEAKLVNGQGFCLSLGTEWIENPTADFDKQDCEQKAFERLAQKLKHEYPRLAICVVADALYPNQTFFQICQQNQWEWMVTFKDGNLPSVWAQLMEPGTTQQKREQTAQCQGHTIHRRYSWVSELKYQGHAVNWFECVEEIDGQSTRFVYLSSLAVAYEEVLVLTQTGRLRWKIENEGFNIQKNQGYGLTHQYSRVSMRATKNYYQCLQIAHLINQLFELGSLMKPLMGGKMTLKHLWKKMLGQIRELTLEAQELEALMGRRLQIRFA